MLSIVLYLICVHL